MCSLLLDMTVSLLQRLLDYYNISYEEYLKINEKHDLSNFVDGHYFKDMDKAVELVKCSIKNNEKIIVYGDYDADGVMGTSILTKMFQYVNYVNSYYLPSRYIDGYGITIEHAKEYVKAGFKLVITVDNGISAFEPIKYLHDNGVKVLVLDHHEKQDELPEADVIIHPIISNFGDVSSSGAFTAFMFASAFLNRVDKYLATLASISLISDMMPLLDYNRNLLKVIFYEYKIGEFLPIDLLCDHEKLNEAVIGMRVAPRINSIGRIKEDDSINQIVKFFTSDNKEFVLNYYSQIIDINEERKNVSKSTGESLAADTSKAAIVEYSNYKEGIIGLVANSLVNSYHVPTIVFTDSGDGVLKGSARSPEGFNIVKAFEALSKYLITYGGHASAGGCSIKKEDFSIFKKEFILLAESTPLVKIEAKTIPLSMNEICEENYQLIASFSPFGEAWPAPIFTLKNINTSTLTFSRDLKHILTSFGYSLRLVGFNFPKDEVCKNEYINLNGTIRKSSYKGNSYLEFVIKEIIPNNN